MGVNISRLEEAVSSQLCQPQPKQPCLQSRSGPTTPMSVCTNLNISKYSNNTSRLFLKHEEELFMSDRDTDKLIDEADEAPLLLVQTDTRLNRVLASMSQAGLNE
ncbi:hypothetical protein SS50377_23916 [Spironucleus salmonicida]|uniref:Uncharacterized protein n=1 Tax=Spironucleus salmonicida TaxID=348837 RepID=V6LX69_9EUKA|nr:hypothetical protein SS50377_23916 [Spironucleus salmonicida]|eukprot:EST48311.1 Hypothetical protein SS50377_11512 [Spironucleus salmonicida]